MMTDSSAQSNQLGQLLMLASSNLPIGSYTYSQGVESAIELGVIHDEASTLIFMQDYLALAMIGYELPVLGLMMQALDQGCEALAASLAHDYRAGLESKEFVLESQQLAQAMVSWLNNVLSLDVPDKIPKDGFLPLFAHVAQHWQWPLSQAMTTYGFAQLENMVLAAVKTVPLGQMAGQRILWQLQSALGIEVQALSDRLCQTAAVLIQSDSHRHTDTDTDTGTQALCHQLYRALHLSNSLPNLAILSSEHERQYSRLFRS